MSLGKVLIFGDGYSTFERFIPEGYTVHSALNNFVSNESYNIKKAVVLSNEREITHRGKITYLPIYYVMFM